MSRGQRSKLLARRAELKAKRSKQADVEERVKSGKCLICDHDATRRGVCTRHYQLFHRRQREKPTPQEQAEFESTAIREGKILAVRQMHRIKREEPFGE